MDTTNLIDTLVDTYRQLNINYRTKDSAEARAIVERMRDDEVQFSQALKDHITGIGTADGPKADIVDGADHTLAHVISQFGTARATTLTLLKGITDSSVWDRTQDDGGTIRSHIEDLVRSDQNQLQRLAEM